MGGYTRRPPSTVHTASTPHCFCHQAFLYHGTSEYVNGVAGFVNAGLVLGEPAMVAVPRPQLDLLRATLRPADKSVHFADMAELGRNPGRIIPAVEEFLREQGWRPARFVGEPIWAGRNPEEVAEATRHQALINLALSGFAVSVLCPYDADALPSLAIADAWRTHTEVVAGGVPAPSSQYSASVHDGRLWPLALPPNQMIMPETYFDDLSVVRARINWEGTAAGLSPDRVDDLVLAVNEVATNSIEHAGGHGIMSLWSDTYYAVVCEVSDSGFITDPLAGLHAPGPDLEARGLWLVNQLCDLLEIRSGGDGTRVRLHFNRCQGQAAVRLATGPPSGPAGGTPASG
jgi:anti-sigma regulatory factor (Ser/Thr protein kinase)